MVSLKVTMARLKLNTSHGHMYTPHYICTCMQHTRGLMKGSKNYKDNPLDDKDSGKDLRLRFHVVSVSRYRQCSRLRGNGRTAVILVVLRLQMSSKQTPHLTCMLAGGHVAGTYMQANKYISCDTSLGMRRAVFLHFAGCASKPLHFGHCAFKARHLKDSARSKEINTP